jgi:hypothetical protein
MKYQEQVEHWQHLAAAGLQEGSRHQNAKQRVSAAALMQ